MLDLFRGLFFFELRNLDFGFRRLGWFRLRLSFVEAVGRVESLAFGDIRGLGHREANAADQIHFDFTFASAADASPGVALKMKNDGSDDAGG